jgi:hypothetical protein
VRLRVDDRAAFFLLGAAVLVAGETQCGTSDAETPPGARSNRSDAFASVAPGTVGVELQLGDGGATLKSVSFVLTGPNGYSQSGVFDVSRAAGVVDLIGGVPQGTGYIVALSGQSPDGAVTCAGASPAFAVSSHAMAVASVVLTCQAAASAGGAAAVQANVGSICPKIDGVDVMPSSIIVGGSIALTPRVRAPNPGSLSYAWSATSGSLSNSTAASPSYSCASVGTPTITLVVGDAVGAGCQATTSFTVQCTAQCMQASDCPGTDTFCAVRTCTAGLCGMADTAAGTPTPTQLQGTCQQTQCDGAGNVVSVPDNGNLPPNTNPCTKAACNGGVPANPPLAADTPCGTQMVCDGAGSCVGCVQASDCAPTTCSPNTCVNEACVSQTAPYGTLCSDNGGAICGGDGTCVPVSVDVLRIGDGTTTPTANSAPVFIEQHRIDGTPFGAFATPLALPTSSSGSNNALTLTGTAVSEGALSLSSNGLYLTAAGYGVAPGNAAASATIPRVVGRVDSSGAIDTSTVLPGSAFVGQPVRSSATVDGTAFWVGGAGAPATDGGPGTGGAWYIPLGSTAGANQLLSTQLRCVEIVGGQLYAGGDLGISPALFAVGTGLPTSGMQTVTGVPGFTAPVGQVTSPWSYVFLRVNASSTGPDTLYVASDRAESAPTPPPDGVQKWTLSGGTWSLAATFNLPTAVGFRGLAGVVSAANTVTLVASTVDDSQPQNRLVLFVDQGASGDAGAGVTATVIYTSPTNEILRGVALPPHH